MFWKCNKKYTFLNINVKNLRQEVTIYVLLSAVYLIDARIKKIIVFALLHLTKSSNKYVYGRLICSVLLTYFIKSFIPARKFNLSVEADTEGGSLGFAGK